VKELKVKSMSEEQIPDEEGIYDDAHNGYETARVTIAPAKTDNEESMSLEEFEKNHPILMAEARAKHFRYGEAYLINDYKIFASGTLRPEVQRADENGLITYTMTQISDPKQPTLTMDQFVVSPTAKLLNLIEDFKISQKEKPGPKTNARQITTRARIRVAHI
jgi:hypothetical protein